MSKDPVSTRQILGYLQLTLVAVAAPQPLGCFVQHVSDEDIALWLANDTKHETPFSHICYPNHDLGEENG